MSTIKLNTLTSGQPASLSLPLSWLMLAVYLSLTELDSIIKMTFCFIASEHLQVKYILESK